MTILILALSVAWICSQPAPCGLVTPSTNKELFLRASLFAEVSWNAVDYRRYLTM